MPDDTPRAVIARAEAVLRDLREALTSYCGTETTTAILRFARLEVADAYPFLRLVDLEGGATHVGGAVTDTSTRVVAQGVLALTERAVSITSDLTAGFVSRAVATLVETARAELLAGAGELELT